jgi:predicted acylesterase/phospholipase RssA
MRVDKDHVENLVFQGGGVRGYAYLGALQSLEKAIDFSHIKSTAGTSAGALIATLLGIGYTVEELLTNMDEMDLTLFLNGNPITTSALLGTKNMLQAESTTSDNTFCNSIKSSGRGATTTTVIGSVSPNLIYQLVKNGGLYDGEVFREWIDDKIAAKFKGIKYITFRELNAKRLDDPHHYKAIYLIGATLNTHDEKIFSFEHTPDVVISDAIRISMSIPFVFRPHQVWIKKDGLRDQDSENPTYYIDGGVVNNYPITLFDQPDSEVNFRTLGFRLLRKDQIDYYEGNAPERQEGSSDLLATVKSHYFTALQQQNLKYDRDEKPRQRSIYIDTFRIKSYDLDIAQEDKYRLLVSGESAVNKVFSPQLIVHGSIQNNPQITYVKSKFSSKHTIKRNRWVVSSIHTGGEYTGGNVFGHAAIVVEGLRENQDIVGGTELFVGRYELAGYMTFKGLFNDMGFTLPPEYEDGWFSEKGLINQIGIREDSSYHVNFDGLVSSGSYYAAPANVEKMIKTVYEDSIKIYAFILQLNAISQTPHKTEEDKLRVMELINNNTAQVKYDSRGKYGLFWEYDTDGINCEDWKNRKLAQIGLATGKEPSKPKLGSGSRCTIV